MQSTRLAILHLAVIHLRDSNLIKKVTLISTTFSADLEKKKRNFDIFHTSLFFLLRYLST